MRSAWMKAIGLDKLPDTNTPVVCSLHFTEDQFYRCSSIPNRLQKYACPNSFFVNEIDSENDLVEDQASVLSLENITIDHTPLNCGEKLPLALNSENSTEIQDRSNASGVTTSDMPTQISQDSMLTQSNRNADASDIGIKITNVHSVAQELHHFINFELDADELEESHPREELYEDLDDTFDEEVKRCDGSHKLDSLKQEPENIFRDENETDNQCVVADTTNTTEQTSESTYGEIESNGMEPPKFPENRMEENTEATRKCCYELCKSDSRIKSYYEDHLYYFVRFPKPCFKYRRCSTKERKKEHVQICRRCAKCVLWVKLCRREDECFNSLDHITKDTYICSLHFKGNGGPTESGPDPINLNQQEIVRKVARTRTPLSENDSQAEEESETQNRTDCIKAIDEVSAISESKKRKLMTCYSTDLDLEQTNDILKVDGDALKVDQRSENNDDNDFMEITDDGNSSNIDLTSQSTTCYVNSTIQSEEYATNMHDDDEVDNAEKYILEEFQIIDEEEDDTFIESERLNVSKTIIRQKNSIYSCPLNCTFLATDRKRIINHLIDHKKKLKPHKVMYKCPICPFTTFYKQSFLDHVIDHEEPLLACKKCLYVARKPSLFQAHLVTAHKVILSCYNCSFRAKHLSSHFKHQALCATKMEWKQRQQDDNDVRCRFDPCPFTATNMEALKTHEWIQHQVGSNNIKNFKCYVDDCLFETFREESFNLHINTHPGCRLKCNQCHYRTLDWQRFKDHVVMHVTDGQTS